MASTVHMSPLPLSSQAMADLLSTVIVLFKGKDANAKDFWAYMCIKPSMAESFKAARENGPMILGDFGTVIQAGDGLDVPIDVQLRMQKEYGVEPDYQEKLLEALEKKRLPQTAS